MSKMISYCGLSCSTCLIHLATIELDEHRKHQMQISIVKQCFEQYHIQLIIDDIADCDGCKENTARLFSGCINCEIRKCAIERRIETCAHCSDYGCEKLRKHFLLDPDSKFRLEELRRTYIE